MNKDKPMTSAQADKLIALLEKQQRTMANDYAEPSPRNMSQAMYEAAEKMFAALQDVNLHPNTRTFIDSLYDTFDENGSLSSKQMRCLTDNYNWFINGIPFTR